MRFDADYKVKDGKFLRAVIDVEDGFIRGIRITGDFFMHPEESLERLESMLVGVSTDEESLRGVLTDFYDGCVESIDEV